MVGAIFYGRGESPLSHHWSNVLLLVMHRGILVSLYPCYFLCTSAKASAMGNSAECRVTTPVVLESTPHETQKQPQNSLSLTPRQPIDGKPGECK